jgi:hypothetical protein
VTGGGAAGGASRTVDAAGSGNRDPLSAGRPGRVELTWIA